jgi:hypothetical protein
LLRVASEQHSSSCLQCGCSEARRSQHDNALALIGRVALQASSLRAPQCDGSRNSLQPLSNHLVVPTSRGRRALRIRLGLASGGSRTATLGAGVAEITSIARQIRRKSRGHGCGTDGNLHAACPTNAQHHASPGSFPRPKMPVPGRRSRNRCYDRRVKRLACHDGSRRGAGSHEMPRRSG